MSTWRERVPETSAFQPAYDVVEAYYHYVVVAALMVFGFWLRTVDWGNYVVGDTVLFTGNDPYYHLRSVQYVVANWPATMPFDPWTNFSLGTSSAQFGTLFDQLIATVALVVGLGSPSDELVRYVLLFTPAVVGVLTFIPAYLIGRRLGGRFGGVIAVAVMAFANGRLYTQSFAGFTDHHVAEALFQSIAILGLMVAITVAEREKPVYELAAERAFGTLRRTVAWSMLAGIGVGLYLFVWPPGVFLLGILGVFFVLYLSLEYLRGRSPEHVAIAGAVAMATTGVLVLSTVDTFVLRATARSMLQPLVAFGVAGGALFMAWLARVYDERDVHPVTLPGTVVGVALVGAGLLAVLAPSTFDYLLNNVLRVIGLGVATSAEAATVGEVAPLPAAQLFEFYSFAVVAAGAGGVIVLFRQFVDDEPRGEELLVVVWIVFMVLAALTQQRFAYYLTVPTAALVAMFAGWTVSLATDVESDEGIETYQILTVGVVILLVVAPMAFMPGNDQETAISAAEQKGTGPDVQGWHESLSWMQDNTPVPGRYGQPDGEAMEYLGTYDRTEDFDYPPGAYGVISWWDYGHWITAMGNRIPNANPFQQGADHAASYLLAQNESAAAAELAERDEDDAKTRFTMIDWRMAESNANANGKFFAPATFKDGVEESTYYSYILPSQRGTNQQTLIRHKQPYYDSMLTRLYRYHGSAMEPEPIVVEWQGQEREFPDFQGNTYTSYPTGPNTSVVQYFDSMEQAREYVAERPEQRQIGGIGPYPTERVPALEHYRFVHATQQSPLSSGDYVQGLQRVIAGTSLQQLLGENATQGQVLGWLHQTSPAWTKTFERVPGATIEGTGPANTNVTARVQLNPDAGSPFTYTQQAETNAEGEFTMTVPYASTGYDEYGPEEGYTNTSVRATGPYELFTGLTPEDNTTVWYGDQVNVTEGKILGEDDSAVTATLEENELEPGNGSDGGASPDAAPGSGGGDAGGTDESGDGSTDASGDGSTDESGDGSSDGSGGAGGTNDTNPTLAPPGASADTGSTAPTLAPTQP